MNQIQSQLKAFELVEDIIDGLDDRSLAELSGGTTKDLDRLIVDLHKEADLIVNSKELLTKDIFGDLQGTANSVENTLRAVSFPYFTLTTLPDFEMNWHHLEWMNMVQLFKYLGIIAARDHSKSFTFSKAYPLWKMFRYQRNDGLRRRSAEYAMSDEGILVTNEYTLAKHLLGLVKEEIEENPILNPILMPTAKNEGWGKEAIKCRNGASLIIKSFGSKMRGYHPKYMIIDDFLNDSSLYSQEQRDKYWNIFSSVIMNMIVPNGQVVVVGTPFHEDDLYAQLKKGGEFKVFEYPAIMPDGTLLWETRHNIDSLSSKLNTQGSIIFSREILCKPVSNESSIFPYKILENSFRGMQSVKLASNIESHSRRFERVVIGCDFAISGNVAADYSVFTVLGVDELDNFHLLNMWRGKGATHNRQMAVLRKMNMDFKPDLIYMEDNGMQQIFVQLAKDANLPVVGKTTGREKLDLYKGLPAISVLFEQGRIKFPRGNPQAIAVTDLYCSELNSITFTDKGKLESAGQHDDTSMSLWKAIQGALHGITDFIVHQ